MSERDRKPGNERAPPAHRRRGYWRSPGDSVHPAQDPAASPDGLRPDGSAPLDRRSALKLIGGSVALAGLAGCDVSPAEDIVPYVDMPEYMVPGKPRYYATALAHDGYGIGVLGETHSGRPTRVEGNPDHPLNGRATSTFAQASVLDLYDRGRSQAVRERDAVSSYDRFVQALDRHRAGWASGDGLRLLTGRVTSPSLLAAIDRFLGRHPQARWYVHEPVDRQAVHDGAMLAFGESVEPVYRFDRARAVLSLDADFLSPEEPAHLGYARDFAAARRVDGPDGRPPARLYAVESTPGLTGAVADHRLPLRADRIEAVARALAQRLGIPVAGGDVRPAEGRWLDALARDLRSNGGRAPVVAGITQRAPVHALAHAINDRLGNAGTTVRHIAPAAPPAAGTLADLAVEMEAGAVDTLIMLDTNPVYTAPADLEFGALMAARVPLTVHWGPEHDETARQAAWHVPATHALESWGDLRDPLGNVALQQPLIRPLFGGRTALEFMAALAGDYRASGRALLRDHWRARGLPGDDFETAWRRALRIGVVEGTAMPERTPTLRADLPALLGEPDRSGPAPDAPVLQFRPDPAAWDGRFANNGWLQELPRPLSKITWDNPALIAPSLAARLGVETGDVVRLTLAGRSLDTPVWVLPGQPDDAVTLTLGYGRKTPGRVGDGVGVDAYRLRTARALWAAPGLEIAPTGGRMGLASTQHHHAMEDRGLVRRAGWDAFVEDPHFAHSGHESPEKSIYPEPRPGSGSAGKEAPNQWGMVIDFDACIGCNACVAACQAENNIPIVGPEEVARGREMHWLRIDRYYAGPLDNPDTVFQPVTCMHCENAPCEYVCPVEATVHSSDGLNEMVYNRCIGTRYCSQNCPYKVRRFNWFDLTGPDAEHRTPSALHNPDVTVRSRGVMEKCTFCVQRISRARIEAKREGRRIATDAVTTACQDACPTEAIVFGDIADADSAVARRKEDPRNYGMLESLNTRPRTTYLAAVRNPNPELSEPDDRG